MNNIFTKNNIASVIVIYKPNFLYFPNVIKSHKKNFSNIILVNNSPEVSLDSYKSKAILIINNSENIGLSRALNVGIKRAKVLNMKMVALFDQDTFLKDNFLQLMLQKINGYKSINRPAIFSSIYFNNVTKSYGSIINFKLFRLIRTPPKNDNLINYPQYVITSGSFIPVSVLDDVGMMLEELFIDFVDIEWCMRARKKGYEVVSFPSVEISHNLGDYSVCFMGTNYPIHSPLRMYYFFRNSIYLYTLPEIDLNWRVVDAARNLFRFLFYMIFVKHRWTYFRYIIKGYYHGFIKKMGKLE